MQRLILSFLFCQIAFMLSAQSFTLKGKVTDEQSGEALSVVSLFEKSTNNLVESDFGGNYEIKLRANKKAVLVVSRLGYNSIEINVPSSPAGTTRRINVSLSSTSQDLNIVIKESRIEDLGMVREDVTELKKIPSTSGNFESVLPHIALGASSGTGGELSSQYNVRGGNYDENLVYVNDFEIFRPQLIRSGQQEGLSFPNIDLIRDLSFSSGGFEAKYGDKLSSVLDISYKRPEESASSFNMSLLGTAFHTEGSFQLGKSSYQKFRYLLGARYKTSRYLLGSLDVKGEYVPNFFDLQTYLTYDITKDLQIGYLGNVNTSVYDFVPVSSKRATGLVNQVLELNTVFDGSETDRFNNSMSGVSLTYLPDRKSNPLFLKLLGSGFFNRESENFDIIGFYRLSQIEANLGSENVGEEIAVLGEGIQQLYARNDLLSTVYTLQHKGGIELQNQDGNKESSHFLQWGLKYRKENIEDDILEWERIDSAGYSLPFDETQVLLSNVLETENTLNSNRYEMYFQDTYSAQVSDKYELKATLGLRAAYWNLNEELIWSPRAQLLFKPLDWENDFSFKLSGGVYYQAPFYREMRRPDGTVNLNLRSQKSIHVVAGFSHDFYWESISKKPFKLIGEFYYKKLSDMVSYEIDNVRIRYSGENDSGGHVIGMDFRLNGEFVKGAESWINLSLLQARENLYDVQHKRREIGSADGVEVSSVPRPTDQFMTLSMFFQDYLPSNDKAKMHMNLSFGTGLPYGLKDANEIFRNTYRFKVYHRIDIGFSYQLWDASQKHRNSRSPFSFSNNAWLSLEVFNLMRVQNQASVTWIKTIGNQQYAIPNFLSSRRINLRLRVDI